MTWRHITLGLTAFSGAVSLLSWVFGVPWLTAFLLGVLAVVCEVQTWAPRREAGTP